MPLDPNALPRTLFPIIRAALVGLGLAPWAYMGDLTPMGRLWRPGLGPAARLAEAT